jgi:hypothetical protein
MVRERRVNDDTVSKVVLFACMTGAFVRKESKRKRRRERGSD